jgi:hypothetical protein
VKRTILAALFVCMTLALPGCGGDNNPPPPQIVADIFSDPAFDGNISLSPTGVLTVTQGFVPSVFAGFPITGEEFRAFLDFPLTGSVPGNAFINFANLNILINNIQTPLNGTIQVFIDLVSYPQPLIGADFDSAFLASISVPFFQSDLGQFVDIDVTPLMITAQNLGLANFQIRIIVATPIGFIEIDTTDLNAPLLTVTYS